MGKKAKKRNPAAGAAPQAAAAPLWLPLLLSVLYFFCLSTNVRSSAAGITLILILVAAVTAVVFYTRWDRLLTAPMLALSLLVVLCGASAFYADNRSFALESVLAVLSSYVLAVLLVLLTRTDSADAGRTAATVLEGAAALAGLVSIDLISTRWISGAILGVLDSVSGGYSYLKGVENGVRMTSMFSNPNVFAGCMGIGVLLSLGLVLSAESRRARVVHLCCLYVCALSFVLAFSMGATAMIVPAFLVCLLLERKDRRAELFLLMLQTLLLAVLAAGVISVTSLDGWVMAQPLPLLCAIVGSAAACLLDRFVMAPIAAALRNKGRLLLLVIVVLLAVTVLFLLLACTVTGGASLEAGDGLRRAVYPASGSYTAAVEADGSVSVTVTGQNRSDTMMHTASTLYEGELSHASFTVPEDTLVVWLDFSAAEDTVLQSVTLQGAEHVRVPLDYPLLPGFISNRLQGLRANQNAIQRLVFFEDGLRIFASAPIFGRGMGAFENGVFSVQSFFYETRYAHNHYVQLLTETGIVGLAAFLLLLAVSAVVLLRQRRREQAHPMTAALFAALLFMAGHAATEVVFSFHAYLPLAFGVFACISLSCAEPIAFGGKKLRIGLLAGLGVFLAAYGVLIGIHTVTVKNVQRNPTHDVIQTAISTDLFAHDEYCMLYLEGAAAPEAPAEIRERADRYAEKLSDRESVMLPLGLAEYYFATGRPRTAMEHLRSFVSYSPAASETWDSAFALLAVYDDGTDAYHDFVRSLHDDMLAWDAAHMGTPELSASSADYLQTIGF